MKRRTLSLIISGLLGVIAILSGIYLMAASVTNLHCRVPKDGLDSNRSPDNRCFEPRQKKQQIEHYVL